MTTIPEDAQRLADRLRMAADEIESAARYGVPIPKLISVSGREFGAMTFAANEDQFTAWAEYVEGVVTHDHHHDANWSGVETRIGDGDRLPLHFHVRHESVTS